jgi:hypothetical protein
MAKAKSETTNQQPVIGLRGRYAFIECEITGITPYMQHRFSEAAEIASGQATRRVKLDNETPRDQAEKLCYRNKEGQLYAPSTQIRAMLIEAGSNHKLKGSRKSLKYAIAGALVIVEQELLILDPDTNQLVSNFEVDSRPVTIPATKGKVMKHRPRFDRWRLRFTLRVNTNIVDVATMAMLLGEGGELLGLGDWRPQRLGQYGMFFVSKFDERKASLSEAAE